jgi:hypothetical protein
MDNIVLLAEIRATIASMPDFATYTPTSQLHLGWLGKADALLGRWNGIERVPFRMATTQLIVKRLRDFHLGTMLAVLHRAEADLALDVPVSAQQVFGPGAVYDFLKALRDILGSASASLLIVDPYLDAEIFDTYLATVSPQVMVRLLAREYGPALKASVPKFVAQTGANVAIRIAKPLHDRVVFVDGASCWVLGQSIKDAAKKGPTYVAPLAADAASLKYAVYDSIWGEATPL